MGWVRALAILALVLAACGPVASNGALPDEVAAPSPTATPSPSPQRGLAPASAGAVADAGVLYLRGADDGIYRYDGATGKLERVFGASAFDRESAEGAYVAGRHGGVTLLRWDGVAVPTGCGGGRLAAVASTGACASVGSGGDDLFSLFIRLPDEKRPRVVLPKDWGATSIAWSPDGQQLLVVRSILPRPGPGMDPGLDALWLLESDGRLRELYRPATHAILRTPRWSPAGRHALVWRVATTSNSFAADGVGVDALLIEVASGKITELGTVMHGWAQWSADGRLAFVNGGSRMTWENKRLIVRERDGRLRAVGDDAHVALAPAWDPARGRLAWVSGPISREGNGGGYIDGDGGGKRVAVVDDGVLPYEVRCDESRAVEGVRWSGDGSALLLLCRKFGRDPQPLELWLHRSNGTMSSLVTGLVGGPLKAGGFGYYGAQPSLFTLVAWSRGRVSCGTSRRREARRRRASRPRRASRGCA